MDVAEVLPDFADAFDFDSFNRMQREALPALLETEANVVASAPTASGKTALAELAMCKVLAEGGTALFVAPMRALTNEKEREWERFTEMGYSVYVVTGERDLHPRRARRADVLVMTPEKLDSATRKHDSRRYDFVTDVDLCVIDEVHLLDSERRGAALEVTVSRLRALCAPRIVALSATMRNVEDVAAWLDAPPETTLAFDEEYRPVELHTDVKTYTHGENAFADKYRRLYRALDLAEPHLREDGQALVFVASRRDTVQAAEKARDELAERDVPIGVRGDYDFHNETKERLDDETLRKCVLDGVAFHHAGLSRNDRDLVEAWFADGQIELLFSTTTLAWGVNLPARCVIIRDTTLHDPLEGEVEMSPLDVLQMLGRAGRPGYDEVGYGWVVCDGSAADRYRRLLRDGRAIESRLEDELEEHLNAEIALGTIEDRDDALAWLETTYYYARGQRAPEEYGFRDLESRVRDALESLVERGFVEMDDSLAVESTALGGLASRYYLRLDTAGAFRALCDRAERTAVDLLRTVASASEFDRVSARGGERDAIEAVLDRHAGGSHGSLGTETGSGGGGGVGKAHGTDDTAVGGAEKVLAVLLSAMDGSTPADLRGDAWAIKQNALRLLGALRAFCHEFDGAHAANQVARVAARVEYGVPASAVGLTAIEGVGPGRARRLANAGVETPADVVAAGRDDLVDVGIPESTASGIVGAARERPAVDLEWDDFPDSIAAGATEPHEVTVRNRGGSATVDIRVTVNGVEMTSVETYLRDETSVPVPVFGAEDELEFVVSVAVPDEPLAPVSASRTVTVE